MSKTRRDFLALAGGASAGIFLGPRLAHAAPAGRRRPAPPTTPPPPEGLLGRALTGVLPPEHQRLAEQALGRAMSGGASYGEARLHRVRRESLSVRDDHISGLGQGTSYGLGLRVLVDGSWGFAATDTLDGRAVRELVRRALASARAQAKVRAEVGAPPVELAPAAAVQGRWASPFEADPFQVSVRDKAELLIAATRRLLEVPGVSFARASVSALREDKIVWTSEGSRVEQAFVRIMPSLVATAVDRRRGSFASRGHEAAPMLAGWEYVQDLALVDAAEEIGEQAVQKLHAPVVRPGHMHVVLAPSNLWLTIHESIGHPTELDRVMGLEANYAGTSFLSLEDAGTRKIGADIVNLVADRTQPGGLATTGWDDEAVPAQRWDIVRGGVFTGWQTTRDQAAWVGEHASRGCSYASAYDQVPFQRMPNVSLQPGTEGYTTEDLIAATDRGVYVSGRGSWSIDHQRDNFQFGGQFFWEIENGRLTRPVRDVAYQSNTEAFWRSCDMLGGAGTYRLGGTFSDGKGQPGQSNAVSHGCPPARFSANVIVAGGVA